MALIDGAGGAELASEDEGCRGRGDDLGSLGMREKGAEGMRARRDSFLFRSGSWTKPYLHASQLPASTLRLSA